MLKEMVDIENFLKDIQSKSSDALATMIDYEQPSYTKSKTPEPLSEETIKNTHKIFTNLDIPVASFKLGGLISGMAISKQSRAENDSRVIMARMIQGNENLSRAINELNIPDFLHQIGSGFFKSVFDEYGDDSVARDVSAGAVFEGVSQLEAMTLLHHRVLFGIEKSTRYMDYSQKRKDGNFNYLVDPLIKQAGLEDKFRSTTDKFFSLYATLMNQESNEHKAIDKWLREEKLTFDVYSEKTQETLHKRRLPEATDEELKLAYERTISAALKDQVRHQIPLSARTTLGLEFNALAMRHLVYLSQSRPFAEGIIIGELFRREIGKLFGPFLGNTEADDNRAKEYREFYFSTRKPRVEKRGISNSYLGEPSERFRNNALKLDMSLYDDFVRIKDESLSLDVMLSIKGSIDDLVSAILCERTSDLIMPQARRDVKNMSNDEKLMNIYNATGIAYELVEGSLITNNYANQRKNRRHRPSRAFERIDIDVTMIMPIAEIRDLRRHTVQSYLDPLYFTPTHSFYISPGLKTIGLENKISSLNGEAIDLWDEINDKAGPYAATTALPMSTRAPMNTSFNLREAYHLLELRTESGAAPVYLRLGQMLYAGIHELMPEIAETMKFVNLKTETDYGRAVQEIRSIAKRKEQQVKVNLA